MKMQNPVEGLECGGGVWSYLDSCCNTTVFPEQGNDVMKVKEGETGIGGLVRTSEGLLAVIQLLGDLLLTCCTAATLVQATIISWVDYCNPLLTSLCLSLASCGLIST